MATPPKDPEGHAKAAEEKKAKAGLLRALAETASDGNPSQLLRKLEAEEEPTGEQDSSGRQGASSVVATEKSKRKKKTVAKPKAPSMDVTTIRLPQRIIDVVEAQAEKEQRKFADMARILLVEAIQNRKIKF